MSQLASLVNCPEIQVELNKLFTDQDPTLITEPLVLTEFLLSPANASGVGQRSLKEMTTPGGGKKRIVEVLYSPRLSEADVSDSTGNTDCTGDAVAGETTTQYDVGDRYFQKSTSINPRDLAYKCEDNTVFFAKKVAQILNVLERAIETEAYTQLALLNGNYSAGYPGVTGDVLVVETRNADGNYSTEAFTEVGTAAKYAAYPGIPIVFGERQWGKYMRETQAGCCAATGINVYDLAVQYGMGFLESYRAADAFGDGGAMMVAPGAVQMLEYLEYEGMAFLDLGTVQQMTITSPITGQRFDMKINIDCNGIFNVFLRKTFKLVTMPSDVFYPDDRLYGVNFVNELQITNP
jgi:hypothetical protein